MLSPKYDCIDFTFKAYLVIVMTDDEHGDGIINIKGLNNEYAFFERPFLNKNRLIAFHLLEQQTQHKNKTLRTYLLHSL